MQPEGRWVLVGSALGGEIQASESFQPVLNSNPLQTIKPPIKCNARLKRVDYTHVNTCRQVCTHTIKDKRQVHLPSSVQDNV